MLPWPPIIMCATLLPPLLPHRRLRPPTDHGRLLFRAAHHAVPRVEGRPVQRALIPPSAAFATVVGPEDGAGRSYYALARARGRRHGHGDRPVPNVGCVVAYQSHVAMRRIIPNGYKLRETSDSDQEES